MKERPQKNEEICSNKQNHEKVKCTEGLNVQRGRKQETKQGDEIKPKRSEDRS